MKRTKKCWPTIQVEWVGTLTRMKPFETRLKFARWRTPCSRKIRSCRWSHESENKAPVATK